MAFPTYSHTSKTGGVGNSLANSAAMLCPELYLAGCFFSVENPEMSWLWMFKGMRGLYTLPGVSFLRFLFEQFCVPFTKPTNFLHNMPCLRLLSDAGRPWQGETIVLRGQNQMAGQTNF